MWVQTYVSLPQIEEEVRKENASYMTMSTHDNIPLQVDDIRKDFDRIERSGRW